MSDFWHYLNVTPMRDYPWWGWLLSVAFIATLTVLLWVADNAFLKWVRRRR